MLKFKNFTVRVFFVTLFLSFFGCGTGHNKKSSISMEANPPFEIKDAFYQDWVAGVKEGGSGTNLHIQFENLEEVSIDSIFFQNKSIAPRRIDNGVVANFTNNVNRDVIMADDPSQEMKNTPPKIPFTLQANEAVIQYSIQGKTAYYKLSNIRRKEMLAYPSANSNNKN